MPTEEKVPETDKAKGKQPVDKDAPASSDAAKAKDGPVLPTGMLAQELSLLRILIHSLRGAERGGSEAQR